jgi:hypothetical protein
MTSPLLWALDAKSPALRPHLISALTTAKPRKA